MADYGDLVEQVMQKGSVTIVTSVTYSSLRRGINRVIQQVNLASEFEDLGVEKFKGEISAAPVPHKGLGKKFKLTYYPNGRELPECFKPKFTFSIVEDSEVTDADPS